MMSQDWQGKNHAIVVVVGVGVAVLVARVHMCAVAGVHYDHYCVGHWNPPCNFHGESTHAMVLLTLARMFPA